MNILEKFNGLNQQINQLEIERNQIVKQAQELQMDIQNYLKDTNNLLEDRYALYASLPNEMKNQYFENDTPDRPIGFKCFLQRMGGIYGDGDLIDDIASWFSIHFDFEKKEIKYDDYEDEFMGYYDSEDKEAIREEIRKTYNYVIVNMIDSTTQWEAGHS